MRPVIWPFLAFLALLPPACLGKEVFHLSNGFDLVADSHAVSGGQVTLVSGEGSLQVSLSQILSIEALPQEAPLPATVLPGKTAITKEEPIPDMVKRISLSQGTAPEFLRLVQSIALAESGLQQSAISPKGAIGIMQLMPATAKSLGVEPQNAEQNAKGGAQLIAELLARYQYNSVLAIAAYNAGTEAVRKYGGLPPFPETQAYVRRVLRIYAQLSKLESLKTGNSAR